MKCVLIAFVGSQTKTLLEDVREAAVIKGFLSITLQDGMGVSYPLYSIRDWELFS